MIDVNLIGAPAFSVARAGDGFVFTGFNRRMAELTGLDRARVIGFPPAECMPGGYVETVAAQYRRCLDEGQAIETESFHEFPAGGRWWHVTLTPVLDGSGAASALVGVATDVTARRTAEREARGAEARMALALDALDGGFWHLDTATGIVTATPKLALRVAGRAAETMTWAAFTAAIDPGGDPTVRDLGPMLRGEVETATVEYRVDHPTEGPRWFRSRRRLMRDEAGRPEGVLGAVLDVTEQRRLQEIFARQARTDSLTGLANRRGFEAGAERFLRAGGGGFGLIVLDLDRFKAINDVHGHATGDAVLREIAARLRGAMRPDDVVARLGATNSPSWRRKRETAPCRSSPSASCRPPRGRSRRRRASCRSGSARASRCGRRATAPSPISRPAPTARSTTSRRAAAAPGRSRPEGRHADGDGGPLRTASSRR